MYTVLDCRPYQNTLKKSHQGHGCLSVVSVVCCQVAVSATSWSLVQRSPADCGALLRVSNKPQERGGHGPGGAEAPQEKKNYSDLLLTLYLINWSFSSCGYYCFLPTSRSLWHYKRATAHDLSSIEQNIKSSSENRYLFPQNKRLLKY